ncbi:MAG: hypothetical protein CME04_05070 [Gemmatimonadaceae bacterium]|nr:hypothetical protein [Gemmatimonadaceae bacterium]
MSDHSLHSLELAAATARQVNSGNFSLIFPRVKLVMPVLLRLGARHSLDGLLVRFQGRWVHRESEVFTRFRAMLTGHDMLIVLTDTASSNFHEDLAGRVAGCPAPTFHRLS